MNKVVRNITASVLCCVVAALLTLSAAVVSGQEKKKLDGKTLFEQKCLKCHKIAKFKEQENSRKEWVLILSRMQRSTCPITDEELEALADYLSKTYGN